MENFSYSSYPDTQNSSPRSREMDSENQSWDEPMSNYKVKFMCSYGGKIQPRPHDNQLSYIGGDTKILSVDRNIRFADFVGKLSSLCDSEVCFKYQLPGEDLDALISVTNDEDLEHMMLEYDRLFGASAKPARLRLFLFMGNLATPGASFDSGSPKSDQQWFVEALNSVPTLPVERSVPVAMGTGANTDFLFGMDKGAPPVVVSKLPDVVKVPPPAAVPVESQVRGVEQVMVGDSVLSQSEIQRQIKELQRMQVSGQEQVVYQQKSDGSDTVRAYGGEYYSTQKVAENVVQTAVPRAVYWQDQSQMTAGGYQVTTGGAGTEQQVYMIPAPGGMYQASANYRPLTGQVAQGQGQAQAYYGTQRMVPREQQVYSAVPAPVAQTIQQPTMGVYAEGMGGRQANEGGYAVTYDGTGRQVYYTAARGGVAPTYQVVSAAAAPVAAINQDGKVAITKPN